VRLTILNKAKAAAQGATSVWADGTTRKKVGKKWIIINAGAPSKKAEGMEVSVRRKAYGYYGYALTTKLGGVVDDVLQKTGVKDFEGLIKKIKIGASDTAHKIYKQIVDAVNAEDGAPGEKRATLDMIGRSLIILRNQFSIKPKTALTVKVPGKKKGEEYYQYKKKAKLPTLKASAISKAKKKMGGWSVTGKLESASVRKMLKTKAAKLISGTIDSRKKWIMTKKAKDLDLKYKGSSLLIRVKQVRKIKDRTRTTAKVEIKIPYEYAKAFLENHIKSVRTKQNFVFRMERSAGYRDFLERAAA
jgi:hypothetical protein